jgi:hypothetical protein
LSIYPFLCPCFFFMNYFSPFARRRGAGRRPRGAKAESLL